MVPAALSLILLDATSDPAEERLAEELELTGIAVQWAPAPSGFAGWALPAQLDQVRPGLAPDAPTAWLVPDGDTLHLSIAFVEAERAVVRVADAARGDEARLALTARELVTTVVPPPPPPPPSLPPPPPPEVSRAVDWQIGVVGMVPVPTPSPRAGVEVEAGNTVGFALGLQLGDGELRTTTSVVGRWHRLRVALGADVVRLPWVLWVEPRAELGVALPLPSGLVVEPRVRGTFLRDQVTRGDVVLYDSGWVEAGIVLGWRQIHRSP